MQEIKRASAIGCSFNTNQEYPSLKPFENALLRTEICT
ncbi:hypothetical protein HMPREF1145_1550 [Oribacterium parvum ACB8]|nr:hypothetical protein HMPREF1145_1550 [Oribacterium parvum ACB8]